MKNPICDNSRPLLIFAGLLSLALVIVIPAYADQTVKTTSGGTIDVSFDTDPASPKPGDQTMLKISFVNKQTHSVQQHIDYFVKIMQGDQQLGGVGTETQPLHTAEGSISIPFQFQSNGTYQVIIEVEGILFQPIPPETASFTLNIGTVPTQGGNMTIANQTGGTTNIPSWVRNTAKWWSQGQVGDSDFVKGLQYMIQNGIIKIPQTQVSSGGPQSNVIPSWIKNTANWWSQGQVGDSDFVKGLQYMIQNGIIKLKS